MEFIQTLKCGPGSECSIGKRIKLEKEIKSLFNSDILEKSAGKFGFRPEDLSDLHGFQNMYCTNGSLAMVLIPSPRLDIMLH